MDTTEGILYACKVVYSNIIIVKKEDAFEELVVVIIEMEVIYFKNILKIF